MLPQGAPLTQANSALSHKLVQAKHAAAEYDAVADAVAQRAWSPDASKFAYATHIDAATDMVVVETSAPAGVTSVLEKKYPGLLRFVNVGAMSRYSRNSDNTPHFAGSAIDSSAGGCSSGPTVRIGATRYGTTAGHCGAAGTNYNSGAFYFGHVAVRPDFPNSDIARISSGGSYSPFIYFGGTTTTATKTQVGAGDPAGAITVWLSGRSGSFSGTVTDINTTFTDTSGTTTACFSTTAMGGPGDSGGVVHTVSGNNAGVRGTVVGGNASRTYYQKWSRIASVLGVSIAT